MHHRVQMKASCIRCPFPRHHRSTAKTTLGSRGVTLLELVVVLFILGLLSTLVFPSFSAFRHDNAKAEARRVSSLLRHLYDSGVSAKEAYPLTFDLGSGIISWKGPEGEKAEKFNSLRGLTLGSRGEIHDGQVTVIFGPSGIAETLEVLLVNEQKSFRISIHHLSGRTTVKDEG